MSRPERSEAEAYYFKYIDQVPQDDVVAVMERQIAECGKIFSGISEEKSLHRYEPEKWSIRQVLNHLTDNERSFVFRALWFGRGFTDPVAGFDQNIAGTGALALGDSWAGKGGGFRGRV